MKNTLLFFILSLSFLTVFNSCNKECQITDGTYEFHISSTLYPALDTFNIGDTITIISEFNDQIYEAKTDMKYDLSNLALPSNFKIWKISNSPTSYAAILNFNILNDSSNDFYYDYYQALNAYSLKGKYDYTQSTYSLTYKIIPEDTGLFMCAHGPLSTGITFPGKCDDMESYFHVVLNNGNDNNISMLSQSPDEHFNTWILEKPYDRFHSGGGYAFYVK